MKRYPLPHLKFETHLWKQGVKKVIGLDEVGRGAFAGPIVVGAVIFPHNFHRKHKSSLLKRVNDSKKLNSLLREDLTQEIKKYCLDWTVGAVPARAIDQIGMGQALQLAAQQALARLIDDNSHVLTDLNLVRKTLFTPKVTEIKFGDAVCFSISAASIIAKVWRDNYMRGIGKQKWLKIYKWEKNVGYGTKYHRFIIKSYGITPYHRLSYLRKIF